MDEDLELETPDDHNCDRFVIYTHSSIHTAIASSLDGFCNVQIEKLSIIKSEHHLSSRLRYFWSQSEAEMLILQCLTSVDSTHMLLAKCKIDHYRQEYLRSAVTGGIRKHTCIIVHIDHNDVKEECNDYHWQFNFLCGWKQVTLDPLEPTSPSLPELLGETVSSHLTNRPVEFQHIIADLLLPCFNCIKYDSHFRAIEDVLTAAKEIAESSRFKAFLQTAVLKFIQNREIDITEESIATHSSWQIDVACDSSLLFRCYGLVGAMKEYMKQCIREPLLKILAFLEKYNAWFGSPRAVNDNTKITQFWQACFNNTSVFDIESTQLPQRFEVESFLVDCRFLDLKFPFFNVFHEKIEEHHEWIMRDVNTHMRCGEGHEYIVIDLAHKLMDILRGIHGLHYEQFIDLHTEDFCSDLYDTFSIEYAPALDKKMRLRIMGWLMDQLPIKTYEMNPLQTISPHICCIMDV